jgi:hypothetical protein
MAKQRSGLVILSALAMLLSLTVSTHAQKREQDRSCTDHKARSDDKPDKPEKREKVELRGSVGPDGKTERIVIEKPN